MCSLGYFQELREGLLVYSACSDPFCFHQDKCITNLPSHEGLPLIAIIFHGLHTAAFQSWWDSSSGTLEWIWMCMYPTFQCKLRNNYLPPSQLDWYMNRLLLMKNDAHKAWSFLAFSILNIIVFATYWWICNFPRPFFATSILVESLCVTHKTPPLGLWRLFLSTISTYLSCCPSFFPLFFFVCTS